MTENGLPAGPGVSVVICCHNSSARLEPTLAHLAAQQVPAGIAWEVLVVDNASTDGTADCARRLWPAKAPAPLRVAHEPIPGLSNARRRGFLEAHHEFVSFIDDDNWACPQWVGLVAEILTAHPEAAVCGGCNEGVFEVQPPNWLERFHGHLAIGPQGDGPADITESRAYLYGAGMSVRRSAWHELLAGSFRFYMSGRTGASLMAGEDAELCYGFMLNGWRLRYDPRLRLQHFMPAGRLTWNYIRRLSRAFGESDVWIDAYRELLTGRPYPKWFAIVEAAARLARHPLKLVLSRFLPMEGDQHIVVQEMFRGRLSALLAHGKGLAQQQADLRVADWAVHRKKHAGSTS